MISRCSIDFENFRDCNSGLRSPIVDQSNKLEEEELILEKCPNNFRHFLTEKFFSR